MSAAERIAPGVLRVTAPNPGPMTGPGTNTYIVGGGPCAIIDPGVDDAAHLATIEGALSGEVAAILITHAHPDHTGGAARLARATGAPVYAYPTRLQGVRDESLHVDRALGEGDRLALGDITLEVIHTPGHTPDHVCFYDRDSGWLFAGDTVMADVTVVIAPPDGHMSDYFDTLARLRDMAIERIAPGHGRVLDQAGAELDAIAAHRREREAQVRAALTDRAARGPRDIAAELYTELDPAMLGVAAAQVEAHLLRLAESRQASRDRAGWRPG